MKRAWLTACLLLAPAIAQAHRPSDSYLALTPAAAPGQLEGSWDIALRDLDRALALDDGDGALTWGELAAREHECARYALARLSIAVPAGNCTLRTGPLQIAQLSDGAYARLPLAVTCPGRADQLTLDYRLLAELDRDHRAIVRAGAAQSVRVISAMQGPVQLAMPGARGAPPATLLLHEFLGRGLLHIFAGLDHMLFLLVLLLPAVLASGDAARTPQIRSVLRDVTKIVTAFTLAHSLTLSLAALGAVKVAARVIEPAIAASVALAALNNLAPRLGSERWALAFALGLLHGFGFSSALSDAGLQSARLVPALLGFNLGVELGQLALVALFVPLAWLARRTRFYRSYALRGGSLAVLGVALLWLFERIQTG